MQLASGQMTPKDDRKPITVQCKIYWIHQHEWNAQWIVQFHAAAPSLAKEIQARKVDMSKLDSEPIDGSPTGGNEANRFTCEDFAFELLIEFASRNKLPLKIKTESATFKNIDKDYKSGNKSAPPTPAGFALDVAYASGAPDVLKNASPVADSDLLPGDLFVEFNGGHIQVITGSTPSKIDIMQGNSPVPAKRRSGNGQAILSSALGYARQMTAIEKVRTISAPRFRTPVTSSVAANGCINATTAITKTGTATSGEP